MTSVAFPAQLQGMIMRSGNPALNEKTFQAFYNEAASGAHAMTIQGTAWKTLILLGLCTGMACFTWSRVVNHDLATAGPLVMVGAIGGLIMALITAFVPRWAGVTSPLYALLEGLFLGGVSGIFEMQYPGIALQAISATFGTLFALLIAYQSGLIRATENFKLGVFAATGGIAILYLVSFVMSFFRASIPFISQPTWLGIGFSVVVVVIAALNLVLDFDFIETAAHRGAPKYLEWYGAFGLMVTLVWLYIEILRLLAKLNSRE
jgi:uncharacterized YccA/Bax inhibitor family protein